MQVGMKNKRLSPRVQHGEEPDLSAEMGWVRGDGAERRRGRVKQQAVDDCLVLERDRRDRFWHGEHDMEIFAVEQVGLTIGDPGSTGQRLAAWTVAIAA